MTGTVLAIKLLLAGTVPANKLLLAGTVLVNKLLLARTVPRSLKEFQDKSVGKLVPLKHLFMENIL